MKILRKEEFIKKDGIFSSEVILASNDGQHQSSINFFVTEEYLGLNHKIYPGEDRKANDWFKAELGRMLSEEDEKIFDFEKWEYDYSKHGVAKNPIR